MSVLFTLFATFFRIGLFSFGGGYAIASFLRDEAVSQGWLTAAEFADILAVSEVTPGPIAVNMATFVGYTQSGVAGSLIATLGVCLPSFILVSITMYFISKVNSSRIVKAAFHGLRPAAAGLIGAAAIKVAWGEFFPGVDLLVFTEGFAVYLPSIIIAVLAFVSMYRFKANPIFVMIGAAAAGIACGYIW